MSDIGQKLSYDENPVLQVFRDKIPLIKLTDSHKKPGQKGIHLPFSHLVDDKPKAKFLWMDHAR